VQDFYNLINVYLDAVLHPRAIDDPRVLQQEGWHFELEKPEEPLTYKGVVYNEMKGVYSSPDSLMGRAAQQALFPDNTYGVDSGGDPLVIPKLTFDQFKAFHASYYHPGNSRVYFYGNDDPMKRLELLDEYLSEFNRININSQVQVQKKVMKPSKVAVPYPIAPGTEPKHMVTVNWLLNDAPLAPKEQLALGVLDSLLLGTSTATLRKTLIESGLGESVTGGGLSDELLQATFSVGLKGVKEPDVPKVEPLVRATLAKLANEGFEEDAVRAAVNTLEFRLREFNTGSFPRGLSLMLGMMSHWIYDKDPMDGVRFEQALSGLKADLAAGKPVFQDLLKRYLITNDHSVTVEMKPDVTLEEQMVKEEADRLAAIKESLSTKEITDIIESTKLLKEAQLAEDSAEARATLPRLSLQDIDRAHQEIPYEKVALPGVPASDVTVLTHPLVTSGILYADIAFDFSRLAHEDLELLPLFSRMVSEAGTSTLDETQLQRKIGAETGGIGTSFYTDLKYSSGVVSSPDDALLYFMIRGKAVADKIPVLLNLVRDMITDTKFDNQKRAVEMLKESKARKESSVLSSGHTFGATRLGAKHSFLGYLGELTGGLTSVRQAGPLLEQAEKDWPSIHKRLVRIRDAVVRKGALLVNLTGDKAVLDVALPEVKKFVEALPAAPAPAALAQQPTLIESFKKEQLVPAKDEAFVIPSQVNYVVKGGPIVAPKQPVSGSTSVVSRYLSTGYLWDTVRVVGGAYGGFARFSPATGRFAYLSYRDPNLKVTLDAYDNAAAALETAAHEITDEDVLQAIIGTVSDLDGPMSSDQKGYASFVQYMSGEQPADRQKWRDEVLGTNPKDFQAFAQQLKGLNAPGAASVVVFGSQAAIDAANEALPEGSKLAVESAFVKKP
jgi:hypothetical protein